MHSSEQTRLAAYVANIGWSLLRSQIITRHDGMVVHESGSLAIVGCEESSAISIRVQGRIRLVFDGKTYTTFESGSWLRYFYQYACDRFGMRHYPTTKPLAGGR